MWHHGICAGKFTLSYGTALRTRTSREHSLGQLLKPRSNLLDTTRTLAAAGDHRRPRQSTNRRRESYRTLLNRNDNGQRSCHGAECVEFELIRVACGSLVGAAERFSAGRHTVSL